MKNIIVVLWLYLLCTKANGQGCVVRDPSYDSPLPPTGERNERGEKTGEWKSYYKTGELCCVSYYQEGEETGEWTCYRRNGEVQSVMHYEKGKAHGEWKSYYYNKQVSSIGNYENGVSVGEWKNYDSTGKLKDFIRFEEGHPYNYYANCQVMFSG